jgi:hypothetical protein
MEKPKPAEVIKPKAGDVVLCLEGSEVGKYAVIDGRIEVEKDAYEICFNANAFRDDKSVSSSGGPVYIPPVTELVFSGRTIERTFWKWRDGFAGAGNGVDYSLTVNLWYYRRKSVWNKFRALKSIDDLEVYNQQSDQALDNVRREMDTLNVDTLNPYRVMRGNHLVTEFREFYNPLSEYHANIIIDAYQRHSVLSLTWHDEPIGCGYIATLCVIGSSKKTAFRSAAEVGDFLDAYGLKVEPDVMGPWEQQAIIPKLDNWKPLRLITPTIA